MTQTIVQFGNSLGVTIPVDFIRKNNLKKGDEIKLTFHVPKITSYEPILDSDLAAAIEEVEARYSKALDELALLQ